MLAQAVNEGAIESEGIGRMIASKNIGRKLAAFLAVALLSSLGSDCAAHRSAAGSRNDAQRQVEQTLNTQLQNPDIRSGYEVHQLFADLYNRMPTFDRAFFSPTVETFYWRSVKWHIQGMIQSPDGKLYARQAFGPGPGLDQEYIARLIDGRYLGNLKLDWASFSRDPRYRSEIISGNMLQPVCRDVRRTGGTLAVVPSRSGGPTVTQKTLREASQGVSSLAGVTIGCYQFAGLNLIQLGHAADAVLFLADGRHLVPLVRGYIDYADPAGTFLIVHGAFAGYDQNGLPLNDYLEAVSLQHRR